MKNKTLLAVLLILLFVIFACNTDKNAYEKAKQVNTIQAFEEFVLNHPDSRYMALAKTWPRNPLPSSVH